MSGLPAGWAHTSLGNLLAVLRGVSYQKNEARNEQGEGLIPLLRANNIQSSSIVLDDLVFVPVGCVSNAQQLTTGDIVIAASSGSRSVVGKAARISTTMPITFGAFCYALKVNPEISNEFISYFLQSPSYRSKISNLSAGINISNLKREHIETFPVSLPPSPEQRRIVAKLDVLLEKSRSIREKINRLPRLLADLRKSVLNSAFCGDLTKEWRANNPNVEPASVLLKRILAERRVKWEADLIAKGKNPKKVKYVEPEPVNAAGLPELPEGWCWVSVESLSTKVVDGVHKKPDYVSDGVPFLTVKDLTAGPGISFENCKYVSQADHQEFIKRTNPEKGDILITKDGTLGVIRAIRTDADFSIFVSLALVKPVAREMSDYLEYAFLSPTLQAQMTGTGSGLQHIHLTDLRKDLVPLPPLDEQHEIVRVLSNLISGVEALVSKVSCANARISSIDFSLLSKAFRGELVHQDLNDEPASVLLERVCFQKLAAEMKQGRKRKTAA